jgi:hypothetical protein
MSNFQWLLIGGPQHGTVVWVKDPVKVLRQYADSPDGDPLKGSFVHYESREFVLYGKRYRIGTQNPSDEQLAEIPDLIQTTRRWPLAGF